MNKQVLIAVLGVDVEEFEAGPAGVTYTYTYESEEDGDICYIEMEDAITTCDLNKNCVKWLNGNGFDVMACYLADGKEWAQLCTHDSNGLFISRSPYFHGLDAFSQAVEWVLK